MKKKLVHSLRRKLIDLVEKSFFLFPFLVVAFTYAGVFSHVQDSHNCIVVGFFLTKRYTGRENGLKFFFCARWGLLFRFSGCCI